MCAREHVKVVAGSIVPSECTCSTLLVPQVHHSWSQLLVTETAWLTPL